MPEPISRHPALQPLSREHHDALMLYFKIRQGLKKGVNCARIADYMRWFFQEHLEPHFLVEEQRLFPLLGNDHPEVIRALSEHKELRRMFTGSLNREEELLAAGSMLEAHVRFEERQLFNLIQDSVKEDRLKAALLTDSAPPSCSLWQDEFWH
jgi:hypothetical protein